MKIQLIRGSYTRQEALELMLKLMDVKIKFHEGKIQSHHSEEDVKMRESRIKELQHDIDKLKMMMGSNDQNWCLDAEINIASH